MPNDTEITFPKIAVLGAGSMGTAIMHGLMSATTDGIVATVQSTAHARRIETGFGGRVTALAIEEVPDANVEAVLGAGVVLVAVKPKYVPGLLAEIAPVLAEGALVVTVAAGVTLETYYRILPPTTAVVRAMPNTPSVVGKGLAGLVIPGDVAETQAALARALFESVGRVVEIPEEQIDALAAVSGSGPAYFYYFVEQLTEAAAALGFDEVTAAALVEATFVGSAALLEAGDRSPAQLRQQVTSPGGTTMEAVAVFETAGWAETARRAFDAAVLKAKVLAQGA